MLHICMYYDNDETTAMDDETTAMDDETTAIDDASPTS